MITNIDKFSNLRFITSSIDPGQLTGKVLKDAQNSIIINTYSGHIGIFVCDGEGNIQRATAEFSNDFNIDGNVASISGAVNELKQQIKDLRDAFNSLSKNGGSVHVPLVTNPPLPKPISVALSPSNVTISDNNVVEVIITTTYDKNFRFPSDIIEPSISTGGTGIMHDVSPYSKQNNVCQHKLRLSKNSNAERNNTITVSVGNVQATLGVTVTKPNDVYAKITKIRTSVDNIVFNNDNTTATITVQKDLSEGIRDDDNRLKTQIIQSDGITVDRVEYTATADTYYISPSGGNGSIKFGVKDENFNSGVNNITVGVVDKRTVVSPSPSVTPTVPSVQKSLRRISKVTVNNGEPITINGGTTKEFGYTITYNGRPEETITDANTDNIDIASNSVVTVEVDKKRNKIRFTANRTFDDKSPTFNVMSNNTKVGEIKVNVARNVVQRISNVTVNGGNPVTITAGTPATVDYTVTYNGDVPDSNTDNIEIASKEGITVTVDSTNKKIKFTTPDNLADKSDVNFIVTSNSKPVGEITVGVTALPLRRITKVTVNSGNPVTITAIKGATVNYTIDKYKGERLDGKEDNITVVTNSDITATVDTKTKKITFTTQNKLGAEAVKFNVMSNDEKVGEITVGIIALPLRRITEVTVNTTNSVQFKAGTDTVVNYTVTYNGDPEHTNSDGKEDNIEISSTPDIGVGINKTNKKIMFTTEATLGARSNVDFIVTSNGERVGEFTVDVTAQEPQRISEVRVNDGNPVTITAGTDKVVSYEIVNYKGELPDKNTGVIAVASKDGIKATVDNTNKTITFRLEHDVISAKSVNFDVISNGERVGTITVNVRYNIVLKGRALEKPMIVVQNRRVALSDLATITGPRGGTLKYRSDLALENLNNELQFTGNENKEGTVTLYVDEDKTVEKSFNVKLYKFADPEIYPITEGLTDNNILESKLPLKLGVRFPSDITFVNDNRLTKEITWSARNDAGNSNFVPTITEVEDQNAKFIAPKNSDYVINATVVYKYNNNIVYTRTIDKHIFVSKNPVRRPTRVTLSSNDIQVTAGDSTRIQYTIDDWTGIDTDTKTYNISVGPIDGNTNEIVGATVHSGDNQIVIGSKTTTTNKTVKFGIFNADNTKIGEFTVHVAAVSKHGLILKEGIVTPLVLFKGNTIYPENLVTITSPYNKDNEKLVVTAPDFSIDTYYRPTIHEDVTRSGTIKIHFSDDADTHIDISAQQYKRPWVTINEGDQTIISGKEKKFTVTYHIDSDNIDERTRDDFRYEIEWSVTNNIGTISKDGKFTSTTVGKGTIEAKVKHFKLNNVIYTQTLTINVTVTPSQEVDYVLTGSTTPVEINQFTKPISKDIYITAYTRDKKTGEINTVKPNYRLDFSNGGTGNDDSINVYLTKTERQNEYKLVIASATQDVLEAKNLRAANGNLVLVNGTSTLTIPFVKNYDSPINGISLKNSTVVIRNTDTTATIEGQVNYRNTSNSVYRRSWDGSTTQMSDLGAIRVVLENWNKYLNNKHNNWKQPIKKTIYNNGKFEIELTREYDQLESGYETKVMIYSEVDPSWSREVHLIYWNDNGDNSLIEPTVSPTPDVPTGNTSGSTPRP